MSESIAAQVVADGKVLHVVLNPKEVWPVEAVDLSDQDIICSVDT